MDRFDSALDGRMSVFTTWGGYALAVVMLGGWVRDAGLPPWLAWVLASAGAVALLGWAREL